MYTHKSQAFKKIILYSSKQVRTMKWSQQTRFYVQINYSSVKTDKPKMA